MIKRKFCLAPLLFVAATATAELPDGYWPAELSQPILDASLRVTLDADLSHLTDAEMRAVGELLQAGRLMHELYERQLHAGSAKAKAALYELHESGASPADTGNLLDLYYLSKGPVTTTLENERLPFLPRDVRTLPVRNITVEELAPWFLAELNSDAEVAAQEITHLEIQVSSGPGQWAAASSGERADKENSA